LGRTAHMLGDVDDMEKCRKSNYKKSQLVFYA